MIHEIFPHRFSNHYSSGAIIGEEDFVFYYHENSMLLKTDGETFALPKKKNFPELTAESDYVFLFTLNDVSCFLVWDVPLPENPSFVFKEIRFFRAIPQQEIAWVSMAGFHLRNWYEQTKFCGKCGAATLKKPDERALFCPDCRATFYPKISPAIIVAITCNDNILLVRSTQYPGNRYSLVAGYVDVGETLEETVRREVKEEVGLVVRNIRYYKSQPWPLSGSMMMGFVAEASDKHPLIVDNIEIAAAEWFPRGRLPVHSPGLSIAGEMIEMFEKGAL